jgi:hypothetical protein
MAEAERRATALLEDARSAASGAAERTAADESLSRLVAREKDFLQRLAGLIQEHMNTVKNEVRTARETPPAPEPEPAPPPPEPEAATPAAAPWAGASQIAATPAEAATEAAAEPALVEEPAVMETAPPPAWEPPAPVDVGPAWREEREPPSLQPSAEQAPPEVVAPIEPMEPEAEPEPVAVVQPEPAFQPEADLESPVAPEPEPLSAPEPAPPPDLEPVSTWEAVSEPEEAKPWVSSDRTDALTPPEAEVVPEVPDEVLPDTSGADFDSGDESADVDLAEEPEPWPPLPGSEEDPGTILEPHESLGDLPSGTRDEGEEPLFEQPTLTGDTVPSPEEPEESERRATGRHEAQGPADLTSMPPAGDEARDDERSIRELFWGEES